MSIAKFTTAPAERFDPTSLVGDLSPESLKAANSTFAKVYAGTLKPNATYETPASAARIGRYKLASYLAYAIATGDRLRVIADAGVGKTSFLKHAIEALGAKMVYLNCALLSPENMGIPMPTDREALQGTEADVRDTALTYLLRAGLGEAGAKIIVLDEVNRTTPGVMNVIMELLQEGSYAGVTIPDLLTVVSLENPQGGDYGQLAGMDYAQASRFTTVALTDRDTPWREALAAKYAATDLADAFAVRDKLSPRLRSLLSPRVLDHLIQVVTHGLSAHYALPAPNNEQLRLVDENGADRTEEVLSTLSISISGSVHERRGDDLDRIFTVARETGANVRIIGKHGRGKTAGTKAALAKAGVRTVYKSAPALMPEDLSIPVPVKELGPDGQPTGKEVLKTVFFEEFQGEEFAFILDEPGRAPRRTQNALMEVVQERSVDGIGIPLLFTVALDNPREVTYADGAPFRYDVGKTDLAQASRYTFNVFLGEDDFGCGEHLHSVYGEVAAPFLEWRKEDISDRARDIIDFRTLERMMKLHLAGMDMGAALPFVNGEHSPISLTSLEQRLENRVPARLSRIVADIDTWEEQLAGRNQLDPTHPEEHDKVQYALKLAELGQLQEHRPAVVRLLRHLAQQHLLSLIKDPDAGAGRQQFFVEALKEAKTSA